MNQEPQSKNQQCDQAAGRLMDAGFRELSQREIEILGRLLGEVFPGRDELTQQVSDCLAKTIDGDGSLEFASQGTVAVVAPVRSRTPTEGSGKDVDSVNIHFLLHVINGRVSELEVFREDAQPVKEWPAPHSLVVFAPDCPAST